MALGVTELLLIKKYWSEVLTSKDLIRLDALGLQIKNGKSDSFMIRNAVSDSHLWYDVTKLLLQVRF